MQGPIIRGDGSSEYTVDLDHVDVNSVSEVVVRTIAAYKGTEPTTLPPLAETVDPEAIDKLGESLLQEPPPGVEEITLQYSGVTVTVCSTGEIRICPSDQSGEF